MIELGLLIGGITEVFKILGVPSRFLPLVSVLIGAVIGYMTIGRDMAGVLTGIVTGLVTAGVVNRVDHVAEKISF
jgi:hypothetical protein